MKPWFFQPDDPSEGLISTEEWIAIGALFSLTARELDVAILLFQARTRAHMSRRLARGESSVRKRIDKVFQKLNVRDKLGLVHRVWQVHRVLFNGAGASKAPRGQKDAPCKSADSD